MKLHLQFATMAMLLFTSCQIYELDSYIKLEVVEDPAELTFIAETETGNMTKTTMSGSAGNDGNYSLLWSKGDAISITDGKATALFTADRGYSSSSTFSCTEGRISSSASQYMAFYPSTITTSNMILPNKQEYLSGDIKNFPMYASSTDKILEFKNLCGIIRFSLQAEESFKMNVASISISSDKGMSGPFKIGENHEAIITEGNDGIILTCEKPVTLMATSASDFNIIVPKGQYDPLKVKIKTSDGNEVNLVSDKAITVNRSAITRISLTMYKSSFDASLESIPITDSDVDFTEI